MHDCLSQIFQTVRQKQDDINAILQQQKGRQPTLIEQSDPFAMYNSFISIFKPMEISYNAKDSQEQIK